MNSLTARRTAWLFVLVTLAGAASWLARDLGSYVTAVPDEDAYRAIVERVRAGEDYYDAAHAVLGPDLTSLFNVRLPTYAWLLGLLPDVSLGRWLFLTLAVIAVGAALCSFFRQASSALVAGAAVLLLGSSAGWVFQSDAYLSTEPWAGALILLSVAAYAQERWLLGAALGAAVLALRELILPYCLVCLILACYERRPREIIFWGAALVLFAVALWRHTAAVHARWPNAAATSVAQWLDLPGPRFFLGTARMNVLLWPLPGWVVGPWLALALGGLAAFPAPCARRLLGVVGSYALAFSIVRGGDYWGLLYAPLLALGVAQAPRALVAFIRAPAATVK